MVAMIKHMIYIEGIRSQFIDTKGTVKETTRANKRFYISVDRIYKIDLNERTILIEVPGLGLDVYEIDNDMLTKIGNELVKY